MTDDSGLGPRRAALGILLAVREGTPFDAALERGLGTLVERDRRLAHELAAGVLRHGQSLDDCLAPNIRKGIDKTEPSVLEVLRIGAYQIRHLERVPKRAAVATAVDLVRETVGDRATGFVNAVLRKVEVRDTGTDGTDTDDATRMSKASSHPHWLVERWLKQFGVPETEELLNWNNQQPALVVQSSSGDLDSLAREFSAAGIKYFQAPFGAGLVLTETNPTKLPGFHEGSFFVQDPAQALVARFVGVPEGATVYDACAAPGGKAMALSARAGRLIAADAARRRIARLRENLNRTSRSNCYTIVADALHPPVREIDVVLLDAPCLGTGTFARHPDARLRVNHRALQRLVSEQSQLLDSLADRVRPGGVLCYSTCSLEEEENRLQVNSFLRRRPDFSRAPRDSGDIPVSDDGDLSILPQCHGMDGAYAARLVRAG